MNNKSIFEKVTALLIDHLGQSAEGAKMESDFHTDLGCDSLDDIEIIMAVEEEFNIEIADEDAAGFKTVGDMVSYLEKRAES